MMRLAALVGLLICAAPVRAQSVLIKPLDTISVTVSVAPKADTVLKMVGSRYVGKAACNGPTLIPVTINASANKKTKQLARGYLHVYCAPDSLTCDAITALFKASNDTTVDTLYTKKISGCLRP